MKVSVSTADLLQVYNAALTISTAALSAVGYRTTGEGHHYVTIQTLAFTLHVDQETIEVFNRFRRKRNVADYDRIDMISEKELAEMIDLAGNLFEKLNAWLTLEHPDLI